MTTPNPLNPNAIPNMSLDDGDQRSSAPSPAPTLAPLSAYQSTTPVVPSGPLLPIEISSETSRPQSRKWQTDDRVLAPWEPEFLYAGTIANINIDESRGDQAKIVFDDGDEGWVFLDSLEPIALKKRARVFCRKNMGNQFLPAVIADVEGESVGVDFEDGTSEWTRVGSLRIPCVPNGPGATPTHYGALRMPVEQADPNYGAGDGAGAGIPGWVIWIGVVILINVLRFGCRSMGN